CNPTLKVNNALALKTRTKSNQTNEKTFPVQGVKENNLSKMDINIYPNPSTGIVNIDFLNSSQNLNYKLQITNTLGQEVYQTNLNNTKSTINVQTLKSGIYFLNIKQNDNVLSAKKIIVE
ncbi:MAG: T9SS type A sorting domain-containing protein, partial [Bacteroidota bacterium]